MAVLGLADEIGRDDQRISAVVGDHGNLGGAGEDVDADLAEQHALGLGDEFVAGANDDVGRLAGEQAEGHRRDRLDAAQAHDDVGARHRQRIEHMRVDALAAERRRAGDDGLDAGGLGRGDGHIGRGDMGIAAGRHIAAGRVHRHELLPEMQAGRDLQREVLAGGALRLGEAAHLPCGEADVILDALRDVADALRDGGLVEDDRPVPFVELEGVVLHRLLAPGLDRGEHLGDHRACGVGFRLRRLGRGLEMGDGHGFRSASERKGWSR